MTNYDIDELERQGLRDFIDQRYDFFDLESEIQNVWQTKDDLDAITERIYDDPEGPMTEDQIGNVLCGLSELHETRCKKLWKVFEAILKERRDKDAVSPVPEVRRGATADNNEITRDYRGVKLDNEGERFRTEGNDPNRWDSGNSDTQIFQTKENTDSEKKLKEARREGEKQGSQTYRQANYFDESEEDE